MTLSRQQIRARQRAARHAGEQILKRGFLTKPTPSEIAAATLALADRLSGTPPLDAVTTFAASALALYEATMKARPPKASLACRQGCNWCCYSTVAATVPEILLAAARAGAKGGAGTPLVQEDGRNPPCPMLQTEGCIVYSARPVMCRVANSLDAEVCREEYEGRNPDRDVPISQVPVEHGVAVRVAMLAALRLKGLDAGLYELRSALGAGADVAEVARQWLAGTAQLSGWRGLDADAFIDGMVKRVVAEVSPQAV